MYWILYECYRMMRILVEMIILHFPKTEVQLLVYYLEPQNVTYST